MSKEILRFFENLLKFYQNFRENLLKNLENFGNMDMYGVLAAEPSNRAKILKNSLKINANLQNFENFPWILANFDLKKLILIKINTVLTEFWKALIILKEIKKPSDKFLRVWAKNQLRFEIFENILKFT